MVIVKIKDLEEFIMNSFLMVGVDDIQAKIAAKHMVFADSQGTDTHGIMRLPIYIERIKKGLIKTRPQLKWERETVNCGTHGYAESNRQSKRKHDWYGNSI